MIAPPKKKTPAGLAPAGVETIALVEGTMEEDTGNSVAFTTNDGLTSS
jgi:hypothetical protein